MALEHNKCYMSLLLLVIKVNPKIGLVTSILWMELA